MRAGRPCLSLSLRSSCPMPFPFSEELCSDEHVDPFEHEPFDVRNLQSLLFSFTVTHLSLVLKDSIHHGSLSSVALRFGHRFSAE